MFDVHPLAVEWYNAKAAEKEAQERRREAEDALIEELNIDPNQEGTDSIDLDGGAKLKVTRRLSRKVDAEAAQELAAEHGLEAHIEQLFRWKPELNKKAWDSASAEITGALAPAVTTTAGRPSFTIETKE